MASARPARPRPARRTAARDRPDRRGARPRPLLGGQAALLRARPDRSLPRSADRDAPEPEQPSRPPRGSFAWVACELDLRPCERFLLALAMLPGFDSAAGAIVAACVNDPAAVHPTLALAQRLWDEPVELLTTAESGHRLERHGLLERPQRDTAVDWRGALFTPALVVRTLLFPSADPPAQLRPLARPGGERIVPHEPAGLEIVPVVGPRGADHTEAAADACTMAGRAVDAFAGGIETLGTPGPARGAGVHVLAARRRPVPGARRRRCGARRPPAAPAQRRARSAAAARRRGARRPRRGAAEPARTCRATCRRCRTRPASRCGGSSLAPRPSATSPAGSASRRGRSGRSPAACGGTARSRPSGS